MLFRGIEICCPHCRGNLEEGVGADSRLSCTGCRRTYPVLSGIPDLRVFPDPYIDIEADREKGQRVAAQLSSSTFQELVEFYYSITPAVPPRHARQYARGLLAGEFRARAALESWETMGGKGEEAGDGAAFLDIGCGTAPLLVAASKRYDRLVGVDIAFRWLVVGKKRLAESGLEIPLICACAEALPFPDTVFDRVAGESVLEHTADQRQALQEAHRVLRPGGRLYLSAPNKFSLGPDPQAGLWAGGFLPERWLAAYVRRQGGIPPKRRLLSARGVRRLFRSAGFVRTRVSVPDIAEAQSRQFSRGLRLLIDVYRLARRLPFMRWGLVLIGPLLHAVASKPGGDDV